MIFTLKLVVTAVHMAALGQIEGGADDISRHGKNGEITRYQVLPVVLHHHGCGTADVEDAAGAARACQRIWQYRVNVFIEDNLRGPDLEELYLLWHRPALVLKPTRQPTRREVERAQRFANLVEALEQNKNNKNNKNTTCKLN